MVDLSAGEKQTEYFSLFFRTYYTVLKKYAAKCNELIFCKGFTGVNESLNYFILERIMVVLNRAHWIIHPLIQVI
jgi:hypothetical protein